MFKIVLLKHGYPSTEHERRIVGAARGRLVDTDPMREAEALRACEDADAIIVRWLKITPAILKTFRKCKVIVRYGVGTDNVDLEAATEAGILVSHAPDYCMEEVSDHAIAMLLGCVRSVVPMHNRMAAGGWEDNPPCKMWRMAGRTLGLVGFGRIGQAVARKLGAWRLRILAADPFADPEKAAALNVKLVDLETLCRESDYVSLHPPLLPETRHLVGRREIGWMKAGAILVTTARGPVLDTTALLEAVESGRLASAGLDVFEQEPLPPDSPLRRHSRIILSDHAAWYSEDSLDELQKAVAMEAVRVCLGGLPVAIANYQVLDKLGRREEWVPNDTARWQMRRSAALAAAGAGNHA